MNDDIDTKVLIYLIKAKPKPNLSYSISIWTELQLNKYNNYEM